MNLLAIKQLFLALAVLLFCANSASAIDNKIKAVVSNEIITDYNIQSKIKLISLINKIPLAQVINDKKVINDVLFKLIDEILVLNKAEKLNLKIEKSEFQNTVNIFLNNANWSQSHLDSLLNSHVIDPHIFNNFIKYEILMGKILQTFLAKPMMSREEKHFFAALFQKKINMMQGSYKIIEFSSNQDLDRLIKHSNIQSCRDIEHILTRNNITDYSAIKVSTKEMNENLLNYIGSTNSANGIFSYKNENNNVFIGFCKISNGANVAINGATIDSLYQQELTKRYVHGFMEELYRNNYIVLNN